MLITRRNWRNLLLAVLTLALTACADDNDYLKAIPAKSTALVSVDVGQAKGVGSKALLKALLHVSNVDGCGLDLASKFYVFETEGGELGLCARVDDGGQLKDFFTKLSARGGCERPKEGRGCTYTVVGDAWVVAFTEQSLLVMGPVTVAAQGEAKSRMARYLKQEKERSILSTRLYAKLDSLPESPLSMVAQVQALPEKLVAPLTLGAPKGTDPSQILMAAGMTVSEETLWIRGETFSFRPAVETALRNSREVFRPIGDRYLRQAQRGTQIGFYMNVEGSRFLSLLRDNEGLQALLAGVNTAIDMDKVLGSVDGNMVLAVPASSDSQLRIDMTAELRDSAFLADVAYWKASCPAGARIEDRGPGQYRYVGRDMSFNFGVANRQFYAGSGTTGLPDASADGPAAPLADRLAGERLCAVLDLQALTAGNEWSGRVQAFLKPLFGEVRTVVYCMK